MTNRSLGRRTALFAGTTAVLVGITTVLLTAPAAATPDPFRPQLVTVETPTRADKALLQTLGLDLTEHAGHDYVEVVLHTPEDVTALVSAGLGYDTTTAGLALLVYTVPVLVMPPIAQWLLLRYQARFVIPAGLFLIGLGFALMKLGSSLTHLGGWTVLPGALVAGIGLGLTTTPATNTTTASVPANRAGMASGMDVSARLITLAVNIDPEDATATYERGILTVRLPILPRPAPRESVTIIVRTS